jgi:hypothetical protein
LPVYRVLGKQQNHWEDSFEYTKRQEATHRVIFFLVPRNRDFLVNNGSQSGQNDFELNFQNDHVDLYIPLPI